MSAPYLYGVPINCFANDSNSSIFFARGVDGRFMLGSIYVCVWRAQGSDLRKIFLCGIMRVGEIKLDFPRHYIWMARSTLFVVCV